VVSKLTTLVLCKGKTKDSRDLNSVWTDGNNATKETSRETYAQSSHGKGNERTSCSIGCYGDNIEANT
jgi:hypothetical protein